MLKQNKGITLVALVITIIVLLILAGVSISLVVGDNGVLTQAKGSSDATKIGQMQEALQIAISDVQTEYFANYATNANKTFDEMVNAGTLHKALANQGYKLLKSDKSEYSDSDTDAFSATVTTCYISDGSSKIKVEITKANANSSALKTNYPQKDANGRVAFNKD